MDSYILDVYINQNLLYTTTLSFLVNLILRGLITGWPVLVPEWLPLYRILTSMGDLSRRGISHYEKPDDGSFVMSRRCECDANLPQMNQIGLRRGLSVRRNAAESRCPFCPSISPQFPWRVNRT